ncbi:MAG: MFS transporter, partial [Candidatus Moraniibacteriota bacterium]
MHREKLNISKTNLLSLLSFFMAFTESSFIYVLSTYFSTAFKTDNVSIFYLIAYGSSFALLFALRSLIRSVGEIRLLSIFFVVLILLASFLAKIPVSLYGAAALIGVIIMVNLVWVTFDIILEGYSTDSVSGRVRGKYLAIISIGSICGPLISTRTLAHFGFNGIFFLSVIGYSLILILILVFLRREYRVVQGIDLKPLATLKKIWYERKDLARIFHVSFGLEFFYATITIYTPIYLISLGLTWDQLGIIFTIMLLPFVTLEYPIGILADKKTGEKELLITGIIIASLATVSFAFLTTLSIAIWAAVLLFSRIGIATIEVLRDSYFYKQVDGDDLDIIAFFRMARPLSNIISAIIVIPLLFIFPIKIIFFLVAFVMGS